MRKHPRSLYLLSVVHFLERFSYYGVSALLLLYFTSRFHFSDAKSYAIFGVYSTLTYATPLIGGALGDKYIGAYRSILLGLFLICFGHLLIYLDGFDVNFYLGLDFISVGSGFYRPHMSTLIANLYDRDSLLRTSAFTIQYIYQNVGAFLAPIICGYLGLHVGWVCGFTTAAFGGVSAYIILMCMRNTRRFSTQEYYYPIKKYIYFILATLCLILSGVLGFIIYYGESTLDLLLWSLVVFVILFIRICINLSPQDRKNMPMVLFGVIAVAVSGALINHGTGVFTLFMQRHIDPILFGLNVPITFVQSIDPLTIIILGSFMVPIWQLFAREKIRISGMVKMLIGFGIIVCGYAALNVLSSSGSVDHLLPMLPFILCLVLLASSDIFIYPNVMTFCSRAAPKSLTGGIMGFVIFGMALSHLFATYFAKMAAIPKTTVSSYDSLKFYEAFFSKMTLISGLLAIMLSFCVYFILRYKK